MNKGKFGWRLLEWILLAGFAIGMVAVGAGMAVFFIVTGFAAIMGTEPYMLAGMGIGVALIGIPTVALSYIAGHLLLD